MIVGRMPRESFGYVIDRDNIVMCALNLALLVGGLTGINDVLS